MKHLSPLQKKILRLSLHHDSTLTNRLAMSDLYGLPLTSSGRQIDRSRAGNRRTNAAAVAVVKSFNRLVARGLATRQYNFGIILTYEGRRIALQLLKIRGKNENAAIKRHS